MPEDLTQIISILDNHNGAITAVFTVLLTVVTGGLVWTGYVQIRTTRAQLRAYVLTARTIVTNVAQGVPEAEVTIKNFGQTPAYNVISVKGFYVGPYPSTPNFIITDREFANPSLSREVLGPGGTAVSADAGPLTPEQRASLTNGTGIIYVYGEIRYRDAFGRQQWTRYRYMMGGPVGLRGDQMAACAEGNEAT
jgi:hypothetical protein